MRFKTLIYLLIITIIFSVGCRKVRKVKNWRKKSKITSQTSRLRPKILSPTVVATGVFVVSQQYLLSAFKSTPNSINQPIQSTFMNNSSPIINLKYSIDGKNWKSEEIELDERLDIISEDSGIIGIESNGNFYQIDESHDYLIESNDGELQFITD